jgi:hypothetical protein
MKNYIGFVNDHSGSMSYGGLQHAAIKDYNANVTATKEAASAEMLDTVVSVVKIGGSVEQQITVSNPHVLKPVNVWPTGGGTPLYEGIINIIDMHNSLPDAHKSDVSFLILITTDGDATDHGYARQAANQIKEMQKSGRWTFVFRVPKGSRHKVKNLGVADGNIQEWETSVAGMEKSSAQTTSAMTQFYSARSAGAKSTSSFYTDASKVDITALTDISKKVSLYLVPDTANGIEIRPFILTHRMEYLKGAAFYQLTKTENRVSHTKQVLVRDRASGKIFAGKEARDMIGLPSDRNARLHPGDHKNFDLFIQSESVNRKLVAGTGVVYWKEIGVPFTDADLAYLQPKAAVPATPPVITLPQVPVSNKPTKSPIPVTPRFEFFNTRDEARSFCNLHGVKQSEILKNPTAIKGRRWSVPTALAKGTATA